jgi:integrase
MGQIDIAAEVRSLNRALKADGHRVAVQARGNRLYLVATLPTKPTSTKRKPHQQRIALHLGASRMGLRRAKAMAILLADQLDRDRFDWGEWTALPGEKPENQTCADWLEAFRQHVWPNLPEDKAQNWTKRYLYFGLNKLPPGQPLTPEALTAAVLTKSPERKAARDRACQRLQELADFAGVSVDLSIFQVGYSPADVVPKVTPNDIEIEDTISKIPHSRWRIVFALMAIYGLRDHEAFLCTLERREGVVVAIVPENTKTGYHVAYPHPVHWVDLWLRGDCTVPQLKARINSDYGSDAAAYWRRLKAPGTPYSLRHAYAIRCHAAGVPVAIAAAWMGHSPAIHLKTYQRWITATVHQQAWQALQGKEN